MPGSVAVSPDLGPFAAALRRHGIDVVDIPREGAGKLPGTVAAVVVTEGANGLLGMWTIEPPVPVVDAAGRTPEDVADEVRNVLGNSSDA